MFWLLVDSITLIYFVLRLLFLSISSSSLDCSSQLFAFLEQALDLGAFFLSIIARVLGGGGLELLGLLDRFAFYVE